jgi:O-antigen ligase
MPRSICDTTDKVPSLTVLLFFLLFFGPPALRKRDPMDSFQGVVDVSVIFQVLVWAVAGLWTVHHLRKDLRMKPRPRLNMPEKLGLSMVVFLGLSTFVSEAPSLTAFKVGQIFVSLVFSWIFVRRYGISKCMDYAFIGSVIMCVALAFSAIFVPDLVYYQDTDGLRLHGDPVAPLPTVATYAIFLLIMKRSEIQKVVFWPLLTFLSTMLVVSLTRHAWFLVIASLLLYLSRKSKATLVSTIGVGLLAVLPFVFFMYFLPALEEYRSTDSIANLTGRTDLWVYLVGLTLARSPWIGLGYYSASRVLGLDFNPNLGTAHSTFVEVLLGGGLLSLIPCLVLCFVLIRRSVQLLSKHRTHLEFVCGTMFLITMVIGLMGGDFACGEVGITFWSLAAAVPAMSLGVTGLSVGRALHSGSVIDRSSASLA